MKKKILFVVIFVIVLIIIIITPVFHKNNYTINVEQIYNFSPDRKLIVYENDKIIEFKELQYTDGTYLCSGTNPTVSYSEIVGVKELIIKIDDKKQIVAKIVEK